MPNPKKNKYKVVFLGTPQFAVPILEALINHPKLEVTAVFTQPDRPVGRSHEITPPPVKKLALESDIKIVQPHKLKNNIEIIHELALLKPDVLVVAAYGHILPKIILDIPRHGAINVHASILPKHRGASPITQAILDGDKETGVSIMRMDIEIDHGSVLGIEKIKIDSKETKGSLEEKLAKLGAEAITKYLPDYLDGKLLPKEQEHHKATWTSLLSGDEGLIDWDNEPETIERAIRAYSPWPSAYTFINNKRVKILEAELSNENSDPNKEFILGGLIVKKVQPEGKKEMSGTDFARGQKEIKITPPPRLQ